MDQIFPLHSSLEKRCSEPSKSHCSFFSLVMESTAIPIYHLETSPQFNLDALAIIPLPSAWDQINAALSRSISTPSELVVVQEINNY